MIRWLIRFLISNQSDMIELQYIASKLANKNEQHSFTVNMITARMIDAGLNPIVDYSRGSPKPTIWSMDKKYGWPSLLIDKYGWDGRKEQK